jgi:phage head maturation protease
LANRTWRREPCRWCWPPITRCSDPAYVEVLDIGRVDLSRGDLPLIESHDAQRLNIGVIRNIRAEGGKLRGLAVFGTSARASEVLADVQAGIVTGVSIGYQLTDEGQPITLADGTAGDVLRIHAIRSSLVAVPADPNADSTARAPPCPQEIPHQGNPS